MKKLVAILLGVTGIRFLLVRYHKSRLRAAGRLMKRFGTESTMPVWCSQRARRHHQALRRLGFVVEKEFALQRRSISGRDCYRAFYQLIRTRFPDDYWSCSTSGKRVIVVAPVTQLQEWQRFISEYDCQVFPSC
jgi:hypothetical protein